jgi:hypothetical protein
MGLLHLERMPRQMGTQLNASDMVVGLVATRSN